MPQDMEPKFVIEEVPIQLVDNNNGQIEGVPENPRTITTTDFLNLKKSLEDDPGFLWLREPLVYPLNGRYVAIAGNQRIRALKELPIEFTPAKILDAETPVEDLIRWAVKDNTNKGEWDWDALSNGEWPEDKLTDWGLDMPEDWGEAHNTNPEEDEIPEPPKTPVSKLGDLWLLDAHRVLCGDSTDRATVERLMDGKKADMVFTDPPYGVDYEYNQYKDIQGKEYHEFCDKWFDIVMQHTDNAVITPGSKHLQEWFNRKKPKHIGVWTKTNAMTRGVVTHFWAHEPILFYGKFTRKRANDVFNYPIGQQKDTGNHTCPKPIEFMVDIIDNFSDPQQIIIDLFLGSGSTLIACEQKNRTCYGLELDPSYIDVICKRWQTLTGTMPILESTGEAHDFLEG